MASTRVLIADDHALLRQGVRQLLQDAYPEFSFAEADGLDAVFTALSSKPAEFLLMDLSMPGMDGANSVRRLREAYPEMKLAILTGQDDRGTILACLSAGAHGYLLKSSPIEDTARAVQTILAGGIYVTATLASTLRTSQQQGAGNPVATAAGGGLERFTPRQREVLGLLGEGCSTKEIARKLDMGEGTVKVHLAAIFRALNAKNRTEAVVLAARLIS